MKTRPDPANETQPGGQRGSGQPTPRANMTTMDRVGAFSGAAYVLLANIGSALLAEGSNRAESP
jgi:hypothetical protein